MVRKDQVPRTAVRDIVDGAGELSFTAGLPPEEQRVRFWGDVPAGPAPRAEAILAAALLPAMTVGGELTLPEPLSPQLRRALPDIQAVLASLASGSSIFDRPLQRVRVVAPAAASVVTPDRRDSNRGVAAFFSGGVDSWATLLANPEVTDLIYVHGFDIPISQADVSAAVEERLGEAARRLGKRLHVVRTNLRAFLDPAVPWELTHGLALVSVAHLFARRCERILIAAGMSYGKLLNRGSHPLHDHLWSTEHCRIEHHGAHLERSAKVAEVAKSQDALDILRVCWREVDRYNCGRCEKCLRTMVALAALGALERCPTFPRRLDLDAVAGVVVGDSDLLGLWQENLALARDRSASPQLIGAVEACLEANAHLANGASNVQAELAEANRRIEALDVELETIRSSRSWRLTRPLRDAGRAARRLTGGAGGGAARRSTESG